MSSKAKPSAISEPSSRNRSYADPIALQLFIQAGLAEPRMALNSLIGEIHSASPDPETPLISESTIVKLSSGNYKRPPAKFAWHIGQAFARLGVTWSSGPLALIACGCDADAMAVFGHFIAQRKAALDLFAMIDWSSPRFDRTRGIA